MSGLRNRRPSAIVLERSLGLHQALELVNDADDVLGVHDPHGMSDTASGNPTRKVALPSVVHNLDLAEVKAPHAFTRELDPNRIVS